MKSRLFLITSIILLALFAIILPLKTNAASSSSILVNVAPENPAPNENTTITLNSYVNNLDSVMIAWSVNGKNVLSGIGKKSFLLNAPAAGGETSVVATVE